MSDPRLDERLDRIEKKIDDVHHAVIEVKVMDAVQNAQLAEHMRRTDALEKLLGSIWTKALTIISIISALFVLAKQVIR